jgi:Tol biopolymer transport system component
MGEVYQAHDTKLGRDVAIKVLPEAFAHDPEKLSRFQREAKLLASLNHPNIATIHGLEDSNGTSYLVMELVPGETLADRVKREGAVPVEEALTTAKQIAEALEYAHEHGVIHRDLKPANVKVTPEGKVKVLDFGLAKAFEGDSATVDMNNSPTLSHAATMQGVILGTAAYMSPEQAKGKAVDKRTDIWAFGCVLYELLTAKQAFYGEDVTDILAAVVRADPDWSRLPGSIPPNIRALLRRCLQKDKLLRLRDAGDARISLDEVLSGEAEPSPASDSSLATPAWRRVLPWAVAGVLASAFAALAFIHLNEKPFAPETVHLEMPLPTKADFSADGAFGLSPNGRQMAFLGGADGVTRLWLRPMDSTDVHVFNDAESPASPPFFWSPDSRYIVFDGGGKLRKIDVASGVAETLCELPGVAVGGSWNRDGVIIFGQSPGAIMKISANGGTTARITSLDASRGETQHVLPSFLPDGRHFVYVRTSIRAENSGIYVGDLNASPESQDSKRLVAATAGLAYVPSSDPSVGQLLFMRGGTLMSQKFDAHGLELLGEPVPVAEGVGVFREFGFFSASTNGVLAYRQDTGDGRTHRFMWFDRQGKSVGTIGEPGVYDYPALSPDGKRAVVTQTGSVNSTGSLWLFDLLRGTSTRLTFGSSLTVTPIWSPDGKRIIFASDARGAYDLYQKPADGSKDEELILETTAPKTPTSLSRDGRFLLYTSVGPKAKNALWVLPLDGDKKPFLFLGDDFDETDGHFSPDGRWVAYQSDESGRLEIYVRKFAPGSAGAGSESGGKWQVSTGGGTEPRWSADGKELYFLTLDRKVMAVDVTAGSIFQVGAPKLLFQAPVQVFNSPGEYTVDGKRFLFLAPVEQTVQTPFTIVLNWEAGLKR